MSEISEHDAPRVLEPKRRAGIKTSDVVILGVIFVIVLSVAVWGIHKYTNRHEINQAKEAVATKAVKALAKQDTKTLFSLGDKKFQATTSPEALDAHLQTTGSDGKPITFADLYGKSLPSLDGELIVNNTRGKHVVFVYKYTALKVPEFVRIDTIQPPGNSHWYLQALTPGTDEAALFTASN